MNTELAGKVKSLLAGGKTYKAVAEELGISIAYVGVLKRENDNTMPETQNVLAPTPVSGSSDANCLDLRDPKKWQMKVRLFLERARAADGEEWLEGIRLIATMAARVVRDQIHRRVTAYCRVCDKPLRDGKPQGEAGYYDADREYIKIYCCTQSEFGELLRRAQQKEDEIRASEERAEKAARQALIDARRASRGTDAVAVK